MTRPDDIYHLILMVRASYDPAARPELSGAATDINWSRLPALADRHRVEGLAWDGLAQAKIEVPPVIADTMRDRAAKVSARQLAAATAASKIATTFATAGIDAMFLKGLVLAAIAYPRPFVKDSCDIDLLVDQRSIGVAAELLTGLGYTLLVPQKIGRITEWHGRYKESVWGDPENGLHVDLHSRLADHPQLMPSIGPHSPRQLIDFANGPLPTFRDEHQYSYLCAHGASSAWFRLKWLTDLHAFILARGPEKLMLWHRVAIDAGVGRASSVALRLLQRLFDLPLPVGLADGWQGDWPSKWLETMALAQLREPREPTGRRLGTLTIHVSQMLQKPGLRYVASDARRQLLDILRR